MDCAVSTCSNSACCRGLCKRHYERHREKGTFLKTEKMNAIGKLVSQSTRTQCGCLVLPESRADSTGYVPVSIGTTGLDVVRDRAHRLAYRAFCGEIPPGMFVCHHCDNRLCIEPTHLFVGTCADNNKDMREKERQSRGESSGRAKLSGLDIVAIRASTQHIKAIAAHFQISVRHAYKIRSSGTWEWFDG